MVFVIGSGPSGVSCAMALLEQGACVTLIDAGTELEPERQAQVQKLSGISPTQWRGQAVDFMKHKATPDHRGIGVKHVYGSDYPYRHVAEFMPIQKQGAETTSSLAVGGFSTVWGAAILPYRQDDLEDWPITAEDLGPHYKSVLSFMDTSMRRDDLAELFPLYHPDPPALEMSGQAKAFLNDLERHREELRRQGIWFGASRLAVRPTEKAGGPGCAYCGLCMYGCPYGLIYTATSTLRQLQRHPNFRYVSGVIVRELKEENGRVQIIGQQRDSGESITFDAERVYLGAGVIASTRILLRSMQAWNTPVTLRDSQYFLLPMLRYAGHSNAAEESLHTLSQLFLEIRDPQLNENTIHLQIYTYNDLYADAMKKMFKATWPVVKLAARTMLGRLLVVQGYLHSKYSADVSVTLRKTADGGDMLHLDADGARSDVADELLKRVVRKITANARYLRARPISFLLSKQQPGRGFHSGGTFPMRRNPGAFETDILGRPTGFTRVHVIDSTVLPSIPATTITFSVMANAHRIGSAYGE